MKAGETEKKGREGERGVKQEKWFELKKRKEEERWNDGVEGERKKKVGWAKVLIFYKEKQDESVAEGFLSWAGMQWMVNKTWSGSFFILVYDEPHFMYMSFWM